MEKMDDTNGTLPTERPKILLVEDDPAVRRSLQFLLLARGFDVRAHASGATLLADPLIDKAVCFVADYRMDDLDGIEVLARLRARAWDRPAILITAYPSQDLIERATKAGFDAVIDKPFREHMLADTVVRLIGTDGHPQHA
jgi:FixJ family two-component response regulator